MVNYVQNGLTLVAALVGDALDATGALTVMVLVGAPLVGWVLRGYSKRTTKAARGAMDGDLDA